MPAAGELSKSQSRIVADAIREQLARKRMSRQRLADEAKLSISTLEKALGGSRPFTLATIVRLEEALGIALRPAGGGKDKKQARAFAPADLGAYSRTAVAWLEGSYLTLRPSFELSGVIYAYRTEISWDDGNGQLVFREAERLDAPFSQKGVVSVPNKSGHIYLYTNEQGQMRLAILGRPLIGGEMYGLLTTLLAGPGSRLVPVAVPLVLIPSAVAKKTALGRIGEGHAAYAGYRAQLDRVGREDFARFAAMERAGAGG